MQLDTSSVKEVTRIVRAPDALLAMTGLCDFGQLYPYELSGGMQQRAGICCALSRDPEVLLMKTASQPKVRSGAADVLQQFGERHPGVVEAVRSGEPLKALTHRLRELVGRAD